MCPIIQMDAVPSRKNSAAAASRRSSVAAMQRFEQVRVTHCEHNAHAVSSTVLLLILHLTPGLQQYCVVLPESIVLLNRKVSTQCVCVLLK
jgi:hypothetical protein